MSVRHLEASVVSFELYRLDNDINV